MERSRTNINAKIELMERNMAHRTRSRGQAATAEQRSAMTFAAIRPKFSWTNEDWSLAFLPRVRLALLALNHDDKSLERFMSGVVKEGIVPDMLDGWVETKEHLRGLAEMLDTALTRSFIVLERLGYDPENPPPDSKMH